MDPSGFHATVLGRGGRERREVDDQRDEHRRGRSAAAANAAPTTANNSNGTNSKFESTPAISRESSDSAARIVGTGEIVSPPPFLTRFPGNQRISRITDVLRPPSPPPPPLPLLPSATPHSFRTQNQTYTNTNINTIINNSIAKPLVHQEFDDANSGHDERNGNSSSNNNRNTTRNGANFVTSPTQLLARDFRQQSTTTTTSTTGSDSLTTNNNHHHITATSFPPQSQSPPPPPPHSLSFHSSSPNNHFLSTITAPSPTPPTPPPLSSHHPYSNNNASHSPLSSSLSSPSNSIRPPRLASGLPPLAPPPGALSSIMASTNGTGAGASRHPHSASPLQAPQTSAGHLSPPDFRHPSREKTSGSFYDPLTDTTRERNTTRERKALDSWSKQVSYTLIITFLISYALFRSTTLEWAPHFSSRYDATGALLKQAMGNLHIHTLMPPPYPLFSGAVMLSSISAISTTKSSITISVGLDRNIIKLGRRGLE